MKKFKKLISIMLTVVMALAMSMTAFATENTKVDLTAKSMSYEIYQVFTGDTAEDGKTLSNVKWGSNAKRPEGTTSDKVDDATLKVLTDLNNATDSAKASTISGYCNFTDPLLKDDGNLVGKSFTVSNEAIKAGYYLVKGTVHYESADGKTKKDAETLYLAQVTKAGSLEITPKSDVPAVVKNIVEDGVKTNINEKAIGDTVNYEIVGTLPSDYANYKTYYYSFNDTLSKGLTYTADTLKVFVVNDGVEQEVTTAFNLNIGDKAVGQPTTINVTCADLKKVNGTSATSSIVVRYDAVLNEEAEIGVEGNENEVDLTYSNNPNYNGIPTPDNPGPHGTTPKSVVETFTTELAILKTDEEGGILEDAEFTLEGTGVKISLVTTETFDVDENGQYYKLKNNSYTLTAPTDETKELYADENKYTLKRVITTQENPAKVVAEVGKDGRITFTGLGEGTYTLKETVTPDGFNTMEDKTFTISFDKNDKTFSSNNAEITLGANNTLQATVINKKGSLLPSTGGIGTTIFYIVGAILVIGAGIILVAKRRMSQEQ